MRLGLTLGYSGSQMHLDWEMILEDERLGYDSVWTAEAWGSDAVSPAAYIAARTSRIKVGTAIMQLPARSPSCTAMTAMTMDALSEGRFILGLGTSGPQVVEGWHGRPWHKPLTWMREYLTIVNTIIAREKPLSFQGEHYRIPYDGPNAAGLGKPLKSILHGRRVPIYQGAMAPKGQALSAELCDGVLLTCMDPTKPEVVTRNLDEGFAISGRSLSDFDLAPTVAVIVVDDLEMARAPLKEMLALYIGGMGARDRNFYKEYVQRVGFEGEAQRIQDLYLAGDKRGAVAAVPDAMVDAFNLVGPPDRIRGEFARWKACNAVGTLVVGARQIEALRLMAELVLS